MGADRGDRRAAGAGPTPMASVRAFLALVDLGDSGVAARRIGTTRAAITAAVEHIEAVVGRPVVHRDVAAHPTETGQRLIDPARRLLDDLERFEEAAQRLQAEQHGRIVVAADGEAAAARLAPVLQRLLQRFPQLEAAVSVEVDADAALDRVRAGTAALAVVRDRADPDLASVPLPVESDVLVAPPQWELAHGIASLRVRPGFPLVAQPASPVRTRSLRRALEAADLIPTVVVRDAPASLLEALVLGGVGAAVVDVATARLLSTAGAHAVGPIEHGSGTFHLVAGPERTVQDRPLDLAELAVPSRRAQQGVRTLR